MNSFLRNQQDARDGGGAARSIQTLDGIFRRRVCMLVLADREPFSTYAPAPRRDHLAPELGRAVTRKAAVAVKQILVASAVANFGHSRVTVVRKRETILAEGQSGSSQGGVAIAKKPASKDRLSTGVAEYPNRSVGAGNARVACERRAHDANARSCGERPYDSPDSSRAINRDKIRRTDRY